MLGAQDRPTLDQAGGTQAQALRQGRATGETSVDTGGARPSGEGQSVTPSAPSGDLGNRHHCRNTGHGVGELICACLRGDQPSSVSISFWREQGPHR